MHGKYTIYLSILYNTSIKNNWYYKNVTKNNPGDLTVT
nr:MAG TPA: hypothetical protein [Caudoviricetes sp.]